MSNKNLRSLKSRIIITLCAFSFLLTLTFSGLIVGVGHLAQDSIFNMEIDKVTDRVYRDYLAGERVFATVPDKFTISIGLDGIDPQLIDILRLESRAIGRYESQSPFDCHYTITALPNSDDRLYILYNTTELESIFANEPLMWSIVIIPAIVTTIIGMFVGMLLSAKIISPVSMLAARVRKAEPGAEIKNLSQGLPGDEIGELAATIEAYTHRLSEFIRREQEFTRNTSHELRTPLAIIKNGSELIRSSIPDLEGKHTAVLNRIDRAVHEMEELVNIFLILARENDISHHFATCDVAEHVEELTGKYKYILAGKNVAYVIKKDCDLRIDIPEMLLQVLLGNLIRNAFQYAEEDTVEILITSNAVEIVNHAEDAGKSAELADDIARGIGHSITDRLCEQLGYEFSFSHQGATATARIVFKS